MKRLLFCIYSIILITCCSRVEQSENIATTKLRQELLKLSLQNKFEEAVLIDISADEKAQIFDNLKNTNNSLNIIEEALINGYLVLLEDIDNGVFPCINIEGLSKKCKRTDWESRNIGFANSIKRLEGSLLLKNVQILNNEILLMKLLNAESLNKNIKQKETELLNQKEKLLQYTKENSWVD